MLGVAGEEERVSSIIAKALCSPVTTLLTHAFVAKKITCGTSWLGNHKYQHYHSVSRGGKRPQGWILPTPMLQP